MMVGLPGRFFFLGKQPGSILEPEDLHPHMMYGALMSSFDVLRQSIRDVFPAVVHLGFLIIFWTDGSRMGGPMEVRKNPWKMNGWNLQITHLERNMIFQTSMIMFHLNLRGV